MAAPITAYIDFASPYSYFMIEPLKALAERSGRQLVLRPVLLWAVLKDHGLVNPLEHPLRRSYFMQDVARSAAFFGRTFIAPEPLQFSAHLAARLFHARAAEQPEEGFLLAMEIYEAVYVRGQPITSSETLTSLPMLAKEPRDRVASQIEGPVGRERLAEAIKEAVRIGVFGVPFVRIDDQNFFGADRLPQIAWHLDNIED